MKVIAPILYFFILFAVRNSYKVMPEKSWKKEKEVKKTDAKKGAKKGKEKSKNLPPLEGNI